MPDGMHYTPYTRAAFQEVCALIQVELSIGKSRIQIANELGVNPRTVSGMIYSYEKGLKETVDNPVPHHQNE